ncbi:MAG: hypothetical protein PUD20_12030 [bacterium]|nr:hypothetical protein [bacterium]
MDIREKEKRKLAKFLLVSSNTGRMSYLIRGLVGGYLVYLIYEMFVENKKAGNVPSAFILIAAAVMLIAGIYFTCSAIYALVNGIYEENLVEEETEETTEEIAVETHAEEINKASAGEHTRTEALDDESQAVTDTE